MTADQYWWLDRNSSWWAKMDRAQAHLNGLSGEVREFARSGGYEVEQVRSAAAHETDLRLRISRPIPIIISTIIGDALHNMRSALDCVAFELAGRHVSRELTEDEQQKCEFPIRDGPAKVDAFFNERSRRPLYGPRERRAIRDVQPGWLHDQVVATGGTPPPGSREQEVRWDSLTLLQRLSNVDKHRTVHLVGWWPDLVYWGGNQGDPNYRWRWGTPPFEDGSVLGTLIGDPGQPAPAPELHHEIELRLFHPPEVRSTDVVGLLRACLTWYRLVIVDHVVSG